MKKFLLFFIIMSSMLFGAFNIKIGVFKNGKNLRQQIAKVKPYVFRKQIIIEKKNNLYYAHAVIAGSGREVSKALKAYKRVFKDAFIGLKVKERQSKRNTKNIAKKKSFNKTKQILQKKKLLPLPKKQEEVLDASGLLMGKSIYLCYVDGPGHLDGRVVQMTFNEKTITYSPLGKKETTEVPYTIDKNMLSLKVMDIEMIHTLRLKKEKYLTVESSIGSKKMHQLRYYFDKQDALNYTSKK